MMHIFQFCRHLRVAPGENTFLPKKTGIFPVKLLEIRMFLYYKNKARGDIFEVKGISKQFC